MLPGLRVPAAATRTPLFFSLNELKKISKTSNTKPAPGMSSAIFVIIFIAIKISRKNGK
jgi:hypothetical protein